MSAAGPDLSSIGYGGPTQTTGTDLSQITYGAPAGVSDVPTAGTFATGAALDWPTLGLGLALGLAAAALFAAAAFEIRKRRTMLHH